MTELVLEINGGKVYVYYRKQLTPEVLAILTRHCEREVLSWDRDEMGN
jgi:hypothetical protein